MAESYSVKAVLSAVDTNFTSTMHKAAKVAGTFKRELTSGFGFGLMVGAGQQAFASISDGIKGMISELDESSRAWQTFEGNMQMTGKPDKEIKRTKKSLQEFAQQTVYSSSDMASTYAQLDAVGVKSTLSLVKGFGGLAAAAENPQQAMKTLSQQATQMAAKPMVQWEDFKLMLEQTPAGISAIAKTMGMSTKDLVKSVQDGTVKTEELFDAISKTGTNKAFSKMATQYKTVGQAVDGLKETLANKLQPTFDRVSKKGIKFVEKLTDALDSINLNKTFKKAEKVLSRFTPYLTTIADEAKRVGSAFGKSAGKIIKKVSKIAAQKENLKTFKSTVKTIGDVFEKLANILGDNSDKIALLITNLPKIILAFKAFRIVKSLVPGISLFSSAMKTLGGKGISALGKKLFGIGKNTEEVGKKSKTSYKKIAATSTAFLKQSAGISMVIASLAGLAVAIKPLASLGTTAVAPLLTFGATISGLFLVFSKFLPKTKKQMGNMIKTVGVFSVAISALALAMTPIAQTGTEGAAAIATFGVVVGGLAAIMSIFGSGLNAAIPGMLGLAAAAVGVGAGMALAKGTIEVLPPLVAQIGNTFSQVATSIALAVTTIVTAVGTTLVNIIQTAGNTISQVVTSISDGFTKVSDGIATVVDSISGGLSGVLDSIAGVIESIGTSAKDAGEGFKLTADGINAIAGLSLVSIAKSLGAVATGLGSVAAAGDGVKSAGDGISSIVSSLSKVKGAAASLTVVSKSITLIKSSCKTASQSISELATEGKKSGNKLVSGFKSTGSKITGVAKNIATGAANAFRSVSFTSVGSNIVTGIISGVNSRSGSLYSSLRSLANGALNAAKAEIKIGSPSRKFRDQVGKHIVTGIVAGINMMKGSLIKTVKDLASTALNTAKNALNTGDFTSASNNFTDSLSDALSNKTDKASKKAEKAIDSYVKKLKKKTKNKKLQKSYEKLGDNTLSAFNKALEKSTQQISSKAQTALDNLANSYQSAYDAVIDKQNSLTSKLRDSVNLYDLDSTISNLSDYQNKLKSLKGKIPDSLLEEILGMDTAEGLNYMNYLNSMGTSQLQAYLNKWNQVYEGSASYAQGLFSSDLNNLSSSYNSQLTTALGSIQNDMKNVGSNVAQGFIDGMKSKQGKMNKTAKELAKQAVKAMKKELGIHSPSKVSAGIAKYFGLGWINELNLMSKKSKKAVNNLIFIPVIPQPQLSLAGAGTMSLNDSYDYNRNEKIVLISTFNVDGREFARHQAEYNRIELNKLDKINTRLGR